MTTFQYDPHTGQKLSRGTWVCAIYDIIIIIEYQFCLLTIALSSRITSPHWIVTYQWISVSQCWRMRPIQMEFYVLKVLVTWILSLKGCMSSKQYGTLCLTATGEPPLCMSVSVLFALRSAVDAARSDAGNPGWYRMGKFPLRLLLVVRKRHHLYLFSFRRSCNYRQTS